MWCSPVGSKNKKPNQNIPPVLYHRRHNNIIVVSRSVARRNGKKNIYGIAALPQLRYRRREYCASRLNSRRRRRLDTHRSGKVRACMQIIIRYIRCDTDDACTRAVLCVRRADDKSLASASYRTRFGGVLDTARKSATQTLRPPATDKTRNPRYNILCFFFCRVCPQRIYLFPYA